MLVGNFLKQHLDAWCAVIFVLLAAGKILFKTLHIRPLSLKSVGALFHNIRCISLL